MKDGADKRHPSPPPETPPLVSKRSLARRSFIALTLGAAACTGSPQPIPPQIPPQDPPQPAPNDMSQPGDGGDAGSGGMSG